MQVKITSAIVIGGKIVKAGTEIEVDDTLGADLKRRGKAEAVKVKADTEMKADAGAK